MYLEILFFSLFLFPFISKEIKFNENKKRIKRKYCSIRPFEGIGQYERATNVNMKKIAPLFT